ncbi:MAG: hypothetical protein IKU86_02535 [Thermoguttaceae bacterium]|nr:hypothetical protein [Thermoguttaceae bacterium]
MRKNRQNWKKTSKRNVSAAVVGALGAILATASVPTSAESTAIPANVSEPAALTSENSAKPAKPAAVWNLGDATLTLGADATAVLTRADGGETSAPVRAFSFVSNGRTVDARRVVRRTEGKTAFETLIVEFEDGTRAKFEAKPGPGSVVLRLLGLDAKSPVDEIAIFRLGAPQGSRIAGQINAAISPDDFRIAVMTAAPNVRPLSSHTGRAQNDREGCSHSFRPLARVDAENVDWDAESGKAREIKLSVKSETVAPKPVAEFCATSTREHGDGWSVRGRSFVNPLDLTGCRAIRVRVWGDGNGQQLKIQLGGESGHRDDYISIDFKGWRTLDLTDPPLNDLSYDDVRRLYFYYNSLPGKTAVRCLIDRVEAVFGEGADERTVLLEDFADVASPLWDAPTRILSANAYKRHGVKGAQCAVVAATAENWPKAVERMQRTAGIPSPKPGGGWRDASQHVRDSYFFLTYFNVDEYEAALQFAKRGGFKQILLLQNSWCESTGHYRVNENNFPGGLPTLRQTIEKFRAEGIRFGFHLLAASVDTNDPYLTPVPDERFLLGESTTLAADLSADATTIPTATDATVFPVGQDPYMGSGQVVRIDDELIRYGDVDANGLTDCERGLYGTKVAAHKKGSAVSHFIRAYGYHTPDLDSDFIDEIAGNFANLANELPLDMIYFDGSELLQRPSDGGEWWYYNARLHKAFYDKIKDKNILYQGSSCSPYSWHMIPRSASADGHDDLKAYLEERSGGFLGMKDNQMRLDVGWYYGYDRNATPDMYEYCLGTTIGYDASFSFQASVGAASKHPFIGEILDMIKAYEELRLSGRVPEEVKALLRVDPELYGKKTVEERNALLVKRNDLRLETAADGSKSFRRIVYPLWQEVGADAASRSWELRVEKPCRLGLQVHFREIDAATADGAKVANPRVKITGENVDAALEIPSEATRGQYLFALPGETPKRYGQPLAEPRPVEMQEVEIRLEPGVYRVEFNADAGSDVPLRVRTPLYTDEVWPIP